MPASAGTLFIVATPIGNLADITFRAVETLRAVDVIVCEDTRQTRKLLDHYEIRKPLVSLHEHNEATRTPELLRTLEHGESVALVSDAGTPLVSDPGFRLVSEAAKTGIPVVPIPGPSAAIAALSASGLATDSFRFGGFLPRKSGERRKLLASLRGDPATLVFYETPHRILEALADVAEVLSDPPVVAARELTKLHEELLRGSASGVLATLRQRATVKGEFTLLIGKSESQAGDHIPVSEAVRLLEAQGVHRMEAIKTVARERGLPKREIYKLVGEGSNRS